MLKHISPNSQPKQALREAEQRDMRLSAFQTVLARAINDHWAVGIGARLVTRTADDGLGSGKWQIMPGFGVRYSLPELVSDSYFVPAMR
jgi:hypothetical protein